MLAAWDRIAAAHDRRGAAVERLAAEADLQHAYHDELTGVLHRQAGRDQLTRAVDRARRAGEPLVIAFVDVDGLKRVNDTHGHAAGDHLLRAVGAALREGMRSYDVVMRFGGDEFVCALPGATLAVADRRLRGVDEVLASAIEGGSISIGLAQLRNGESLDEAIGRADREMYDRRDADRAGVTQRTTRPAATSVRHLD